MSSVKNIATPLQTASDSEEALVDQADIPPHRKLSKLSLAASLATLILVISIALFFTSPKQHLRKHGTIPTTEGTQLYEYNTCPPRFSLDTQEFHRRVESDDFDNVCYQSKEIGDTHPSFRALIRARDAANSMCETCMPSGLDAGPNLTWCEYRQLNAGVRAASEEMDNYFRELQLRGQGLSYDARIQSKNAAASQAFLVIRAGIAARRELKKYETVEPKFCINDMKEFPMYSLQGSVQLKIKNAATQAFEGAAKNCTSVEWARCMTDDLTKVEDGHGHYVPESIGRAVYRKMRDGSVGSDMNQWNAMEAKIAKYLEKCQQYTLKCPYKAITEDQTLLKSIGGMVMRYAMPKIDYKVSASAAIDYILAGAVDNGQKQRFSSNMTTLFQEAFRVHNTDPGTVRMKCANMAKYCLKTSTIRGLTTFDAALQCAARCLERLVDFPSAEYEQKYKIKETNITKNGPPNFRNFQLIQEMTTYIVSVLPAGEATGYSEDSETVIMQLMLRRYIDQDLGLATGKAKIAKHEQIKTSAGLMLAERMRNEILFGTNTTKQTLCEAFDRIQDNMQRPGTLPENRKWGEHRWKVHLYMHEAALAMHKLAYIKGHSEEATSDTMYECAQNYYLRRIPDNFVADPNDYDAYVACYRVGIAVKYMEAVKLSAQNSPYALEANREGMKRAHDFAVDWMTSPRLGATPQKKASGHYTDHLTTVPMQCIQMVYANHLVGCESCYSRDAPAPPPPPQQQPLDECKNCECNYQGCCSERLNYKLKLLSYWRENAPPAPEGQNGQDGRFSRTHGGLKNLIMGNTDNRIGHDPDPKNDCTLLKESLRKSEDRLKEYKIELNAECIENLPVKQTLLSFDACLMDTKVTDLRVKENYFFGNLSKNFTRDSKSSGQFGDARVEGARSSRRDYSVYRIKALTQKDGNSNALQTKLAKQLKKLVTDGTYGVRDATAANFKTVFQSWSNPTKELDAHLPVSKAYTERKHTRCVAGILGDPVECEVGVTSVLECSWRCEMNAKCSAFDFQFASSPKHGTANCCRLHIDKQTVFQPVTDALTEGEFFNPETQMVSCYTRC
eukprot:TRINITY_DN47815_c0_g1_i1.p1 TRINITY_DN47815_c0_g1~~TRINITY_DN47815_c0_g1_i1.p1  ORF type:complete len:1092 (+),score=120.52 TRINITY_DN47815_c0_g1_i1:66-3278(+)